MSIAAIKAMSHVNTENHGERNHLKLLPAAPNCRLKEIFLPSFFDKKNEAPQKIAKKKLSLIEIADKING